MDIINLSNNLLKREYLLIYLLVSSVSKFPQLMKFSRYYHFRNEFHKWKQWEGC